MAIEIGIAQSLMTYGPLLEIVENSVFPTALPEDFSNFPALTFQTITDREEYGIGTVLSYITIQFDSWSKRAQDTVLAIAALNNLIRNLEGTTLTTGELVIACEKVGGSSYFEEQARIYRRRTEWRITYSDPNIS
jgi:hypothetical protein